MQERLDLEKQLRRHFGLAGFRPLQKEIIEAVLAGKDAVAILPTGLGKSLCYQLPALLFPGLTVVISPLISLMKDQVDSLVQRGIAAVALTSHDTPQEGRVKLVGIGRGQFKLIFVAPERLQNEVFLAALGSARVRVSLLAVDEAHCVSQWGHDFRPEYRQIPEFHQAIGRPPLLALTATARPSVQSDLQQQLGVLNALVFRASADRPNLWFGVDHCQSEAEREAKLTHLISEADGSAIVYVTSRKEAENWGRALSSALSEPVLYYHGGMGAEERTAVQNRFMTDQVRVVVATNAFGMGIDKANIRLVVHAGVPDSLEAYFQELGRAGRDGGPAECRMVLVPGRDVKVREHLMFQSNPDEPALQRFQQMRIYVYLKQQCRRDFLLRYFGERPPAKAEACCCTCHPRPFTVVVPTVAGRSRRTIKPHSNPPPTPVASAQSPMQAAILERLKSWRRQLAVQRGVPAFVIFGDRDLEGVAAAAPRTLADLSGCRGVGPTKLREYGEAILAEIVAALPADAAPAPDSQQEVVDGGKVSHQETATAHFIAGRTIQETATLMGLAHSTVFGYLVKWLTIDTSGLWKQAVRLVLTPESYRTIRAALLAETDGRLKAVYEALGCRYTYDQIRVAKVVMEKVKPDLK